MDHQKFEMVSGGYGEHRSPMTETTMQSDTAATRGFLFALSAYLLWGFLPFYMKAVAHIPSAEVVAHRIVWSVPLAGLLLIWLGRTADILDTLAVVAVIPVA